MAPVNVRVGNQRGSVLLIALVLILAMTILGLALFDLAQIEGQMAGTSQADARALYIAQAGLERGIRELRNGWMADSTAVGGYGTESWADLVNGPLCTVTCSAAQYNPMIVANTTVPATGTDPGGSYALELKLVLVAEANNPISQGAAYTYPYGQECIPDTVTPTVCANLVFLRSTGTANGPPGITSAATVQTLVKATPTSPFAAALTAGNGSPPNQAIDGDVLAAGTIQALGFISTDPVIYLQGGAGAGQRNNYATLNATYELDRIRRRQLICPPQTDCTGGANLVESLGAEMRVVGNTTHNMVHLGNNTPAGQAVNTAAYGQAGNTRAGKGRLDGIYVGKGCALPCLTQAFILDPGAALNVDYNNFTKPYPDQPPRLPLFYNAGNSFPVLDNPTLINGTAYASYSTNFMTVNAARLDNVVPNGLNCVPPGAAECTASGSMLGALFTSFTQSSPAFRHTFTFTNKAGVPTTAEICHARPTLSAGSRGANLPAQPNNVPPGYNQADHTIEFGIPTCANPNPPTNPVLIYWPSNIAITRSGPPRPISYRGSAIIMQPNNLLLLEETLLSYCTVSTGSPGTECALGERFAEDHLLVFLTAGEVQIGVTNANIDTVMAYVWSNLFISMIQATKLIGSLRAPSLCFRNATAAPCSGGTLGGVPAVYQATPIDLRRIPEELPGGGASGDRWRIDSVPRFYLVCRPGALPSTPTGSCGYQ
jgi:Tfp pilus assembly protein PilX